MIWWSLSFNFNFVENAKRRVRGCPTDWFADAQDAGVAQDLEHFVGRKPSLRLPLVHVWVDLLVNDLEHKHATVTRCEVCTCMCLVRHNTNYNRGAIITLVHLNY